jgi:tRNA-(ms[2]io[6]A)-hydroxylase
MEKHVLGLELPTDPRWVDIAEKNVGDILTDHAYCEQKAATSCISLIVQFHDKDKLVETLTPVVMEEWNHFARVVAELKKRNLALGPPRRDEYVALLAQLEKKGGSREQQLVERLLMNAMIEARSCERFRLLWKEIRDEELSTFYYELMVAEAGHYKNFISLAKEYWDPSAVHQRWHDLLTQEAGIMKQLQVRGDRMH